MKIDYVLKNLGLQDKEPEVYLALLKTPGVQPASVIATKAGLNRTTVYKALIQLTKRGLATKTQRHGITCFFAEDPENRLKLLVDERRRQLNQMNQTILDELPLLTVNEKDSDQLPKIRYYEGVEGLKKIYEAILKEGKDQYRYGDMANMYETLGFYAEEYVKKRNKAGIVTHAIMPFDRGNDKVLAKNKREHRDALYIPRQFFPIEGEIRIFGDKVAIISLRKESPIGVIIESQTIANMFLSIYMLTWENHGCRGMRFE